MSIAADQEVEAGLLGDAVYHLSSQDQDSLDKLTECLGEHVTQLKACAWDLVPKVCDCLTNENFEKNPDFFHSCERFLLRVADLANPKEVLLGVLEQADTFKDDSKFKALLSPLKKCLLRLEKKRFSSLEISLETLYGHLAAIIEPPEYNLEGEERKLLDEDETIRRISSTTVHMMDFLSPFVDELSIKYHLENAEVTEMQRYKLSKFLIRVLGHPLVFVDLTHDDDREELEGRSQSRQCADKLLELMSHLQGDFHKVAKVMLEELEGHRRKQDKKKSSSSFDQDDEDDMDTEYPPSDMGLSCFAYLVLGEGIRRENIPYVYCHEYLLQVCAIFGTILLRRKESLIVEKGVRLFEGLLSMTSSGVLTSDLLDSVDISVIVQDLIQVIVFFPNKEIRSNSVKLLANFIDKFDRRGRHKVLLNLFHTNTHSGMISFLIAQLKNQINLSLKMETPCRFFTGSQLWKILSVVYKLPNEETTDLLEQSDRIMAALNLLRYLCIRDKADENVTGIWDHISHIKESFCKPLRVGLNMSKAHYQMELASAEKGEVYGRQRGDEPEVSLTVSGQSMAEMPQDQRVQVVNVALHSFDMMELVLGRVEELLA